MKIPILLFDDIPPLDIGLMNRVNQFTNRMFNAHSEPWWITLINEDLRTLNRNENNNIVYPHNVSLRPCSILKTSSNDLISFSPQRQGEISLRPSEVVPKLNLLADHPIWRQTDAILSSILSITDDTEITL